MFPHANVLAFVTNPIHHVTDIVIFRTSCSNHPEVSQMECEAQQNHLR